MGLAQLRIIGLCGTLRVTTAGNPGLCVTDSTGIQVITNDVTVRVNRRSLLDNLNNPVTTHKFRGAATVYLSSYAHAINEFSNLCRL